jgi:tRNA (adenine22-N1)-methyltransferase
MQLSKRLKAVADSVTKGNRVADVGCDHAYISIYLTEQNIAPYVIAMDVNNGPLERAKENIINNKLSDKIDTRLSDGLQKISPEEADTILIAGMGGALVVRILTEGFSVVQNIKELVLQPQSEIFLVRHFLHDSGFAIIKEQMLIDDGKFYVIIKAILTKKKEIYDKELFYQYGKLLLEEKDPIAFEFLNRELRIKKQVIDELTQNPTQKAVERLNELHQEVSYIRDAISYYS